MEAIPSGKEAAREQASTFLSFSILLLIETCLSNHDIIFLCMTRNFVNLFSLHTSFFFAPEDGDQMVRLDYIGKQLFKGCIGMEMFQELINHSPSFKSVFSLPDLPEANTPA